VASQNKSSVNHWGQLVICTAFVFIRFNLKLPVEALQNLESSPPATQVAQAAESILEYLERQNEYFLT
jgi:hypothetical protein